MSHSAEGGIPTRRKQGAAQAWKRHGEDRLLRAARIIAPALRHLRGAIRRSSPFSASVTR
jgi:hypothetical protein